MALKFHREAVRVAAAQGIEDPTVDLTRRGHARLLGRHRGREFIYVLPTSPGDRRVYANLKTDIRRWIKRGVV